MEEKLWQGPLRPKEESVEMLCPEFSHASPGLSGGVAWHDATHTHSFELNVSRERQAGAYFPKTRQDKRGNALFNRGDMSTS